MFRVSFAIALIFIPSAIRADDEAAAREAIDRAVRVVAGSADKLEALRTWRAEMDGKIVAGAGEIVTKKFVRASGTDQFRGTFDMSVGGQNARVLILVNAQTGSRTGPTGQLDELSLVEWNEFRDSVYAWSLPTLLPLLDKGNTFTALPSEKVNDAEAIGFRVERKGRPAVAVYFDKQTGLLVKTSYEGREAGQKTLKETTYGGHKAFGGIVLPTKVTDSLAGRKAASWTVTDYQIGGTEEAKTFEKP